MNNTLIIAAAVIVWSTILGYSIANITLTSQTDNTITVQWEGKANLVPDIYTFSITAEHTADTTKAVSDALATQLAQTQIILDENTIEQKDIQSQGININRNRIYDNNSSREQWYRGTHTLNITIRDIDNAGQIIDSLTAIDGLLVNGGSYDHDDESSTLEIARSNAFEDARSKAEALAKLSGMKLGKPLSISENIINNNYPIMYRAVSMEMAADSSVPSTEINPWQQELQVQLNVVFEMR